jgi:hypothetical protein
MAGRITFGGVPLADEKAKMERDERWPYEKFGLKEEYKYKLSKKHKIPMPSKNPEDYDIPVNAPKPIILENGRTKEQVEMNAKKQLAAAAWEEYKRRFMEKGLIAYNGKSVARELNFTNNALARYMEKAAEEAENNSNGTPLAGTPLARGLAFKKSRRLRRQRRQKKTRRQRRQKKTRRQRK